MDNIFVRLKVNEATFRHVDMEFVHKHIEMDSFENFVCILIRKHPILSFNKYIVSSENNTNSALLLIFERPLI